MIGSAAAGLVLALALPATAAQRAPQDLERTVDAWATSDCAYAESTATCDPLVAHLDLRNETAEPVTFAIDGPAGPSEVVAPTGGATTTLAFTADGEATYTVTVAGEPLRTFVLLHRCVDGDCAAGQEFQVSYVDPEGGGGFVAYRAAPDGTLSELAAGLASGKTERTPAPTATLTPDCAAGTVDVLLALPRAASARAELEVVVDGAPSPQVVGPGETLAFTVAGEVVEVHAATGLLAAFDRATACTEVLGVAAERSSPTAAAPAAPAETLPVTGAREWRLLALAWASIVAGCALLRSAPRVPARVVRTG